MATPNNLPKLPADYFAREFRILRLLGLNLNHQFSSLTFRILYNIYAFLMIFIWIFLFLIIEFLYLSEVVGNIDEISFTCCYLITHTLGFLKCMLMLFRRSTINELFVKLSQGIFAPNFNRGGITEFIIVKQAVDTIQSFVNIFFTAVWVVVGSRVVQSLLINHTLESNKVFTSNGSDLHPRSLPYKSWSPCDKTITPCYEITFLVQTIALVLNGYYIFTTDILIIGIFIHLKAQFTILRKNIETVNIRAENKSNTFSSSFDQNRILNEELGECIKHHQEIIALSDVMELEFNQLVLFQFLGSLLNICLSLFQVSITKVDSANFVSIVGYGLTMVLQLLLFCYWGEELSYESGSISQAAYNCDWVGADRKFQKSLLLIMTRAQRPVYVTAGKFSTLSLITFIAVLRGSGSYYAVLRTMNIEK